MYNAQQVGKIQKRSGGGGRGVRGRGRGGNNNLQANMADASSTNAPAYTSIFGGLAFCLKATVNGRMRQVNGV